MKTNNEIISASRAAIMGIAALWIMVFHGTIEVPIYGVMTFIKIGYLGVDIFMFMSGFSMYHSFTRSCQCNTRQFIKKRALRILPSFIPFAILWYTHYFYSNYSTFDMLKNAIHMKEFWITMVTFRWFVPCILFCYLFTPLIHKIFNRFGFKYPVLILIILPIILVSFIFQGSSVALMFLLRLPTYVIGYYYAAGKTKEWIVLRTFACIAGYIGYYFLLRNFSDVYLCDTGLYWYPAILLTPSMVLCVANLFSRVHGKLICLFGKYSFEMYLWHVFLLFPFIDLLKKENIQFDQYNIIINLIVIFLTLPVAYIYSKAIAYMKGLGKKKE